MAAEKKDMIEASLIYIRAKSKHGEEPTNEFLKETVEAIKKEVRREFLTKIITRLDAMSEKTGEDAISVELLIKILENCKRENE